MEIKQAEFLTTVASEKILKSTKNEFAFVGRSNAGKSSLINALTKNSKLAKVGQTPGVTRNINYFKINKGDLYFVDLPGYGFHKAGKQEEDKWAEILENYLQNSPCLKCVFVLVDSRIPASENDKIMIKFLNQYQIPFCVLATKCDKLKNSEIERNRKLVAHSLALGESNVIMCSSQTKVGMKDILKTIDNFM